MAAEALELALTFYTDEWKDLPKARSETGNAQDRGSGFERGEIQAVFGAARLGHQKS